MKTRTLIACGLMVAVVSVLSQIAVPLPVSPVPVSLGTLAVFLCGGLLTPGAAALSMAAYLLLGTVGVPVFSSFGSGVGKLLGPTGGFLFSYPAMAAIVSLAVRAGFARRKYPLRIAVGAGGMAVAMLVCYACGTAWYCITQQASVTVALGACVIPFIIPDALKIALASAALPALHGRLSKAGAAA